MLSDEMLDDQHWVSVQDPIKQMFLAVSKAVRSQAASIRDLDRKYSDLVSRDAVQRLVRSSFDQCCSKQDATQIIYQLEAKAKQTDVSLIDIKLNEVIQRLDNLTDLSQQHSSSLSNFSSRIEKIENDIISLRNPSYDNIYSYVDRQINNTILDFERKIAIKADMKYVDESVPKRIIELHRAMNTKLNDFRNELNYCATKEQFNELASKKADSHEIRDLVVEISDRVSRHELHQAVSNQIKPLITAMTALEKTVQIQELSAKQSFNDFFVKANTLEKMYKTQIEKETAKDSYIDISRVIEDKLREIKRDEVTRITLDTSLSQQKENLLQHMSVMNETLRLEIESVQKLEFSNSQKQLEHRLDDTKNTIIELNNKHNKTKKAVKELSLNIAKALGKKLDTKDFRHTVKKLKKLSIEDSPSSSSNDLKDQTFITAASKPKTHYSSEGEYDVLLNSLRSKNQSQSSPFPVSSKRSSELNPDYFSDDDDNFMSSINPAPRSQSETEGGSSGSNHRVNPLDLINSKGPSPNKPQRGKVEHSAKKFRFNTSNQSFKDNLSTEKEGKIDENYNFLKERLDTLQEVVSQLQQRVNEKEIQLHNQSSFNHSVLNSTVEQQQQQLEWRLALGDATMNLRREMSDKVSREEMYSSVRREIDEMESKVGSIKRNLEQSASSESLVKLKNEFQQLQVKVAGELLGARFLWTSGQLLGEGWIPWDLQAINGAPAVFIWEKQSTKITVRLPGIYRLTVSFFTIVPSVVQIYLNDEPLFSYQPKVDDPTGKQNITNNERFALIRQRHSAGEVSSLSIEEYISLPPDSNIMVRFYSNSAAQGFLAIKKI